MRIENFAPRAHKRTAALIVLRLRRPADRAQISALISALFEAGIAPATQAMSEDGEHPVEVAPAAAEDVEYPVEVLAVQWRPPKPADANDHRATIEALGAQFEIDTVWCVQSTAWARKDPRAADETPGEARTKARKKWKSIVPVWSPKDGPLRFPVDGYPEILAEELDWEDYGIAVKLGGPRLAGEEQVLDAFSQLWCLSFKRFRHVGMEYDRARRAAVIWIDRWFFPGSDRKAVQHTLWLAARIHEILPVWHASFQTADMTWKYRALTGDNSEPFILGGNPLRSVYRERGEEGVAAWIDHSPAEWSLAEVAAMLVAIVEEHPPGDPVSTPAAVRLAERAIALDPEQDQARADILTFLVHNGHFGEALRRIDQWRRPYLSGFLVAVVDKHAPDRVAEVIAALPVRSENVAMLDWYGLSPRTLPPALWSGLATRDDVADRGGPLLARLVADLDTDTAAMVVSAVARAAPERLVEFLRLLPVDARAVAYLYPAAYQVLRTPNSRNPRDVTPESLAICERIMDGSVPADTGSWYTWAHASAIMFAYHLGDLDRATELIDRSMHLGEQNPAIYFNAACVYAGGRHDAARGLDLLRRAVRAGFRDVKAIRTNHDLVLLHDNSEFQTILTMARPQTSPTVAGSQRD